MATRSPFSLVVASAILAAVAGQGIADDTKAATPAGPAVEPYAPGLGDFMTAYGTLTESCNSRHTAARHGFLQIRVPATDPFPDQNFGAR